MSKILDLTNRRVGRLLCLESIGSINNQRMWRCLCDCGNYADVKASVLNKQMTMSCGCLQKEAVSKALKTHGMTKTLTFQTWFAMKARCSNTNHPDYANYGGRGIVYDVKWERFENFFEDMGERPSVKHSIERVDVNGNYCKDNCVWTDDTSLQAYNRTRRVTNTSGKTGVKLHSRTGKWQADICCKGNRKYLGLFQNIEDAIAARERAEIKYYGFLTKDGR